MSGTADKEKSPSVIQVELEAVRQASRETRKMIDQITDQFVEDVENELQKSKKKP